MFKKFFKALAAETVYSKTYRELQSLSDYELSDIGLNRGMIHSVAREAEQMAVAKTNNSKQNFSEFEVHP